MIYIYTKHNATLV